MLTVFPRALPVVLLAAAVVLRLAGGPAAAQDTPAPVGGGGVQSVVPGAPGAPPLPEPVGGQRDAHGCLGPAGYMWCAARSACVRPWELAASQGLPVSEETFNTLCGPSPAKP